MISASEAIKFKLLDSVADKQSLEETCVHYAKWALAMASISMPKKIHEMKSSSAIIEACHKFQKKMPPKQMGTEAMHGAIAAIKASASSSSYDEGCEIEEEIFMDLLLNSKQGRGYRYAFFAERLSTKRPLPQPIIAQNPDSNFTTQKIKVFSQPRNSVIGVIGAGTMGSGIALSFLLSRTQYKQVILVDVNPKGLERGTSFITKTLKKKKKASAIARLFSTTSLQELHSCNLVIEAVYENLKLKQNIFDQLQSIVQDQNAIFASNTSTLSIDAITEKITKPRDKARCAGMHFFSPAHVMRLVEIVQSSYSAPETLGVLRFVTKAIGKVGVVVGNCDGFVGNRMIAPYSTESVFVVKDIGTGVGVSMVDDAIGRKNKTGAGFGMAIGPFGKANQANDFRIYASLLNLIVFFT